MSKTRFLPSRSSQSTGGRQTQKHTITEQWHTCSEGSEQESAQSISGKYRKEWQILLCKRGAPSLGRDLTLVLSLVRMEETGQQEGALWRGRMQGRQW